VTVSLPSNLDAIWFEKRGREMKKSLVFLISGILVWETIRLLQRSRDGVPFLSRHEQEFLNLIMEGYTDNEISECLHVGEKTIELYSRNILNKLKLHDMSSAIKYLIEEGLVSITYA
jgi:DNA-binding NarL/FixJ family response regulator